MIESIDSLEIKYLIYWLYVPWFSVQGSLKPITLTKNENLCFIYFLKFLAFVALNFKKSSRFKLVQLMYKMSIHTDQVTNVTLMSRYMN